METSYKLNKGLIVTGGILGVILVTSIYLYFDKKKKDKFASKLLEELSKVLNPTTDGISGENAFDPKFYEQTVKRVKGRVRVVKKSYASDLADELNDALSSWFDKNKVFEILSRLEDKVEASLVAKTFEDNSYGSLMIRLNEDLSTEDVEKALALVKPLPAFTII